MLRSLRRAFRGGRVDAMALARLVGHACDSTEVSEFLRRVDLMSIRRDPGNGLGFPQSGIMIRSSQGKWDTVTFCDTRVPLQSGFHFPGLFLKAWRLANRSRASSLSLDRPSVNSGMMVEPTPRTSRRFRHDGKYKQEVKVEGL